MGSDYLWWVTRYNARHIGAMVESLQPDEDVEVIAQKHRGKSLAWAWNQGLKQIGKYKAVIISNDDVVCKPDTGKVLTDVLDKVGRKTKTLIVSAYDINLHKGDHGNIWIPSKVVYPQAFMFAVDERLKETVGEFDERFWPFLFEDTDMYHRIQLAGYDWASAVPVWHVGGGSVTTQKAVDERNRYFEINKLKYIEKWGGIPGEEQWTNPRPKLARYYHNTVSDVKD